ncbi:similar to Saccharomyces cerevisiae YBR225W Putative protein of unknown function [Maudiozyma saulgeensis]|uniref:Uncharacterized protein n=1 Tax=Maudiozyma saulgeensis TaxID=1789683 RepID=A0A1X7R1K7_9SACH|nr:similar to Saccharomyces cerevisiae YBR225W Putative protein of unknown function [Kazachstania saulgeensis]
MMEPQRVDNNKINNIHGPEQVSKDSNTFKKNYIMNKIENDIDRDSVDPKQITDFNTETNYTTNLNNLTSSLPKPDKKSSPIAFNAPFNPAYIPDSTTKQQNIETSDSEFSPYSKHLTSQLESREDSNTMHTEKPMKRLGSIHGKTTEIAEAQIANKRWDWNSLPSSHNAPLEIADGYNVASISIDGEMKSIKYDPKYNKILPQMDLFLRFNQESTMREALLFAKKRLKSYAKFLDQYIKQLSNGDGHVLNFNSDINLLTSDTNESQVMEVIQLWSFQIETYFAQANSLLFSPEVTQSLINRRSQRRKSTTTSADETVYTQKSDSNRSLPRSDQTATIMDPLEDIDILLLRPLVTQEIGWQLAYNEPQITVADYALNVAPWKESDEDSNSKLLEFMEGTDKTYNYGVGTTITSELNDIIHINNLNSPEYLLDCMDRKFSDRKPFDIRKFGSQDVGNNIDDNNDVSSITRSEHSINFHKDLSDNTSIKSYAAPSSASTNKKKRKDYKPKKSGFVNFFRRKHTSVSTPVNENTTLHTQAQPPELLASRSTIGTIPTTSGFNVTNTAPVFDKPLSNQPNTFDSIDESIAKPTKFNENELQNEWLENHFCEILSNYKRVGIPTQYYFPRNKSSGLTREVSPGSQVKIAPDSSQESVNSEEHLRAHNKVTNRGYHGRELLQLRLPFNRDSVPAILCPWIWTTLTRTKWGNLLREIKRCLQPGGYILALATDLRVSNSEYTGHPEASAEFKTSVERNRVFDLLSIEAMNKGLHIYPTKHLARKFKECGFVNIKTTTLSLKSGDLKTNMGCINEFMITLLWHLLTGSNIGKEGSSSTLKVDNIIERYIKEHWEKVDDHAGCLRTIFIVAQKPKT